MDKPKRIQLDHSKLVGVRLAKSAIKDGKLSLAQAMVGGSKVCLLNNPQP